MNKQEQDNIPKYYKHWSQIKILPNGDVEGKATRINYDQVVKNFNRFIGQENRIKKFVALVEKFQKENNGKLF